MEINKTCDIFIKSYRKDFKLLSYSLLSIAKNVTGYNNIIILIPEKDKHLFDTRNLPERTLVHYVKEYGNGYLFQQWCKLSAFKYCYSEFIMFSDSDVIFDHPINLQDFVSDGKPEILYTHYSKVGQAICWKQPTEQFIGQPIEWEMMRRNCILYRRSTLEAISNFAPDLENTVMNSGSFSEFNCMSAYAFIYEREKYNFVNTDEWQYTPPKGEQLWSWSEKDNQDPTHKYEYQRSIDTINRVLGLNITEI